MKYVMTKRDRALLIGLFGLLIFGAVYYFVYIGYTDKTTALKNENSGLQNRVDVLQSISDQQGDLISKTSANNQKVEEILKKFPSLVLEEDGIMLAVELQLNSPLETISAIGINIPEEIYTVADIKGMTDEVVNGYIPNATVQQVAPEEEAAPEQAPEEATANDLPKLCVKTFTISNKTDYDGLKNSIRYIVENDKRCDLEVNATYDIETGVLTSNLTIGKYYVTGTDKPYEAPDIQHVIQGTDNIFGTINLRESKPINLETFEYNRVGIEVNPDEESEEDD